MVFYRRQARWRGLCVALLLLCLTVSCLVQLLIFSNNIYCIRWKTKTVVEKLCEHYNRGLVAGQMCRNMCSNDEPFVIHSCYSSHLAKAVVFSAELRSQTVVMKSTYDSLELFEPFPIKMEVETNQDFAKATSELSKIIKTMVSVSIGNDELDFTYSDDKRFINSILFKDFGIADNAAIDIERKMSVLKSLWLLIQQKEYLTFKILESSGMFPIVLGSCGHLYAVHYFRPATDFLNSEWKRRISVALGIFSWLEKAQYHYTQPIRICDVKLNHFGVSKSNYNDVRFLDADDVYFQPTLNNIVSFKNECFTHQDCSYFDCEMECDLRRNVCNTLKINNNLQVTCLKLFFGPYSIFKPNFLHSVPNYMAGHEEHLKQLLKSFCSTIVNATQFNFDQIKANLKTMHNY